MALVAKYTNFGPWDMLKQNKPTQKRLFIKREQNKKKKKKKKMKLETILFK